MTGASAGIVIFGDVIRSRDDAPAATGWLRTLSAELGRAYPPATRLASFGFTQGDELQGLLAPGADPFLAVLHGALHEEARPMRWAIALGDVDPGRGPATERTGAAFLAARSLLDAARARRDPVLVRVGSGPVDTLLDDVAPLLGDLLAELTDRQRLLARLMLLEGRRRSEAATRLGVSRATVSVMAERARIRRIDGLVAALRRIVADASATAPTARTRA